MTMIKSAPPASAPPACAPEGSRLKYLQYLRKDDPPTKEIRPCLPPLMVRSAHGKYRSSPTSGRPRGACADSTATSKQRYSTSRRPSKNKIAATPEAEGDHVFPKEVWEGPMFRIYKESPKLIMTLPRVKALRALLRLRDFETKTGFSEDDFTPPDELTYYRPLVRKPRRASNAMSGKTDISRLTSSARMLGSALQKTRANRLPTIDGGNE